MGSRQAFRRFEFEIRQQRNRVAVRLAREYSPERKRLLDLYNDILTDLRPLYDEVANGTLSTEAFSARVSSLLNRMETDTARAAASLERLAIRAGLSLGADALGAGGVIARFGTPLIESVTAAVQIVDSPAWQTVMGRFGSYHAEKAANIVLTMIADGESPFAISRALANYFEVRKTPFNVAIERLVRTTQIYASRYGTQAIYQRHGVKEWIWSAGLDDRVCVMCVSQHGTKHPVDEILNDHHNGRCAMLPVTPTWESLGFRGGKEPLFETGLDWLQNQSTEVQRRIMGADLYQAWQDDRLILSPELLTDTYLNSIFGEMRHAATLETILNRAGIVRN